MILPKFINQFLLLSLSVLLFYSCQQESEKSYLKSPFTKLDTLSTNDWWKRGVSKIIDMKVDRDKVIAFGIYTTSNNTLKLSAQLFPLYPKETRSVTLAIYQNDRWEQVQTQEVNELGWSAQFRIENWDMNQSFRYKLLHGPSASFEGLIRKDPINKKEIKLAALSCNSNKDRGDRENYVNNINALRPGSSFFCWGSVL